MIEFDLPAGKTNMPVVLGLGVFDGVHRGHRKIISELSAMGRRCGAVPVAVTFIPHPREVLSSPPLPRLLLPPEERFRRLREAGAEGIGIIRFSRRIAEMTPAEFVSELLKLEPQVRGICVGSKWRFGRGGDGGTSFLAAELSRRGIAFDAVSELKMGGVIVSSSGIREAIATGDISGAAEMLGALPCLYGSVRAGFGIAGKELHAPTANIRVDFGVLPPDGVYATISEVGGRSFPSVTNIGLSPTFGGTPERRVESHLIGFSGDLYQKKVVVEIVTRIRGERKFATASDLAEQIDADRKKAMELLSGTEASK